MKSLPGLKFKPKQQHLKSTDLYSLGQKRLINDLLINYRAENTHGHPLKYLSKIRLNINLSGNAEELVENIAILFTSTPAFYK